MAWIPISLFCAIFNLPPLSGKIFRTMKAKYESNHTDQNTAGSNQQREREGLEKTSKGGS